LPVETFPEPCLFSLEDGCVVALVPEAGFRASWVFALLCVVAGFDVPERLLPPAGREPSFRCASSDNGNNKVARQIIKPVASVVKCNKVFMVFWIYFNLQR
jgi:hypothetical protein